ncbi:MAG: DUF4382 domain-containing protein [Nitrospirae bacterium]|nr:DUF4382 domain-containing protein [Nitrospirota bacterium]
MRTPWLSVVVVAFSLLLIWGCGSGGTGTLSVSMTDASPCGFDQVNVTVSSVRVHESATANENDAGWSEITLSPPQKINLTALTNGVLAELGQTALPAGHYTQLRLVLVPNSPSEPLNNSVVPTGGSEVPLETPSAVQSGVKLIHEFDVAADTLVDLVLDFDACRSIVAKGNGGYLLKPVISVIPTIVSGQIAGVVDPALSGSNPVVYAEQDGHVVKSTIPDENGNFVLSPLQESSTAGDYDVVITADAHVTAAIHSVPVTAQAATTVSTSGAPIQLDGSTTHSVSGTVLPVSAEALLRATQTFSSGPAIEVRSVSATLSDGSYVMTLPTGDPLLGDFGGGSLPITLTADSSIAGKYDLEASAVGYQTQSVPIDISSGDITNQNFTLTP